MVQLYIQSSKNAPFLCRYSCILYSQCHYDTNTLIESCKLKRQKNDHRISHSAVGVFLQHFLSRIRKKWLRTKEAAHLADFNEKVHKPQSKSYGRISANLQLIFTHIYLLNLNTSQFTCITTFWGLRDSKGPILMHSKLMTLILIGGF